MQRYLPALVLALAGMVTAPVLGKVRNALLDAFPRTFVFVLATVLGGAFVVLLAYGVWRIRSHRRARYGALAAVAALVAAQTFLLSRGIALVDVVEKIHLVQYGLLAFLFFRAQRRAEDPSILVIPLLGALVGGTLEEWVQWWSQVRVGEIKDVALNVYAGLCGLLAGLAFLPPQRFSWHLPSRRRFALGIATALALMLTGAFYQRAHLGHLVRDPAIGSFRSFFTAEELLETSRKRAEAWARKAPNFKSSFRGEDRFASEAGRHVGHRNVCRSDGRFLVAWRENQILEKYYSPFLDLSLPGTPQGHRLARPEIEKMRSALPASLPGGYESEVQRGRVDAWTTPARLWLVVGSLALVCVIWGLAGLRSAGRSARDKGESGDPNAEGNGSSGGT